MPKKKVTKEKDTDSVKERKAVKPKKETARKDKSKVPDSVPQETEEKGIDTSADVGENGDKKSKKPDRYFEAVGRRKTATARVRLFTRAGDFTVNDKLYSGYFSTLALQKIVEDALKKMKLFGRFRVSIKVSGGGMHSQAEAVRHGLSRCLIKFNPDFRKRLKRAGFLKRDPRMKERKKFGLKKARRAPQWAKR
jgi:small subunit ribosomal protein S9